MNDTFFFFEILILIKTKNIDVCCFQIITLKLVMIIPFNDTNKKQPLKKRNP